MSSWLAARNWPAKAWRWWRRKRQTSRPQKLLIDALRPLAAVSQAALAAVASQTVPSKVSWALTAIVFYVTFDRLFLTDLFKPKRLEEETARRAKRMTTALIELARSLAGAERSKAQVQHIEAGALNIVRSEVESLVGMEDGVYLNVSLIVPEPGQSDSLLCINRADLTRPRRRYRRADRLVTRVIEENSRLYDDRYEPKGEEEYRSILMFPIPAPSGDHAMGAITIDSSLPDQFTDLENKLYTVCRPAIALLTICLTLRREEDLWPGVS